MKKMDGTYTSPDAVKRKLSSKPHIQFNQIVETDSGEKIDLQKSFEYFDDNEYNFRAIIEVRIGKTFKTDNVEYKKIKIRKTETITITEEATLGSLKTNSVVLPEPASGVHCKLLMYGDKLILRDVYINFIILDGCRRYIWNTYISFSLN